MSTSTSKKETDRFPVVDPHGCRYVVVEFTTYRVARSMGGAMETTVIGTSYHLDSGEDVGKRSNTAYHLIDGTPLTRVTADQDDDDADDEGED